MVMLLLLLAPLATALAPVFELHAALDAPVIDRALARAQPGGPNSGFEGGLYFKTSDAPAFLTCAFSETPYNTGIGRRRSAT